MSLLISNRYLADSPMLAFSPNDWKLSPGGGVITLMSSFEGCHVLACAGFDIKIDDITEKAYI